MSTSEIIYLKRRVKELENKVQEMIDYINRNEANVERRLRNLEELNRPTYSPVDMSKVEHR